MATWNLDTGNAGCDEIGLIGTYEEVLADVLNFHDLKELPNGWELVEAENEETNMKRQKHEAIEQAQYRAEEDAERKPAERFNKYYILSGEGTGEGRWHSVRATPSTVAWMLKRERCGGDRWARAFLLLANRTDGTGYDIESGDLRDLRGIIHNQ